MSVTVNAEISKSENLKQFVKFCLIGLSSTALDVLISRRLMDAYGMNWLLANTLSFLVAVTNGYIWNSLWTFRGMGAARRHTQYVKFVAVNLVGYLLNNSIMKLVFILFTHQIVMKSEPPRTVWFIAKALAIVLVSAWNFLANKRWTFAETAE